LTNLAALYQLQQRYEEAERLYRRALAIDEAAFGGQHPSVARDLGNLAGLYVEMKRPAEAEQASTKALGIQVRNTLRDER